MQHKFIDSSANNSVSCYYGLVFHNGSGQQNLPTSIEDFYKLGLLNSISKLQFKYLLPGTGLKPPTCVDFVPAGFCPSCGRVHVVSGNCGSPHCPDCATGWRYDRVKTIFERLFSYKISLKTRVIHAVVSIPDAEADLLRSKEDVDELRRVVYRYCETKGFDGGLVIFHPYRLLEDKKQELRDIAAGLNEWSPGKFGLWKTLVQLDNWRDFVYWSPHFHIIGAAAYLQPAVKGEGFMFKRVGDLKQPVDIIRASMYLLSHAGISTSVNVKNVFWFGGLSNGNWSLSHAPVLVQDYTRRMLHEHLQGWSLSEGVYFNMCPVCLEDYLSMSVAPRFFGRFDAATDQRLRYFYGWYSGTIPPPDKKVVYQLLQDQDDGVVSTCVNVAVDDGLVYCSHCHELIGYRDDVGNGGYCPECFELSRFRSKKKNW